jgi:hypothetical protein
VANRDAPAAIPSRGSAYGQVAAEARFPAPFVLKESAIPLLNKTTQLHGTPLYAALLDDARDVCAVIIKAGDGSSEEEHDPTARAALQSIFVRDVRLQAASNTTR